jgi:hypothetical protein
MKDVLTTERRPFELSPWPIKKQDLGPSEMAPIWHMEMLIRRLAIGITRAALAASPTAGRR